MLEFFGFDVAESVLGAAVMGLLIYPDFVRFYGAELRKWFPDFHYHVGGCLTRDGALLSAALAIPVLGMVNWGIASISGVDVYGRAAGKAASA